MRRRIRIVASDVGRRAEARRLGEGERADAEIVLHLQRRLRELRIRSVATWRARHFGRVADEIVDGRRRQRGRAVRPVASRRRTQDSLRRLHVEHERPDRVRHREHPRRRLRLRRHRARPARPERFEARRWLHRRGATDLDRIAHRDRLRDVDPRLREAVAHLRARPRHERRQERSAHGRPVVAEIRVAERRGLAEQRDDPDHGGERRQYARAPSHALSRSTPGALTCSRPRGPASARRPPSRKAFRIL